MTEVRHATGDDLAAVLELYDDYDRAPEPRPADGDALRILSALRAQGALLVAEHDGCIVGSFSLYLCASLAHGGRPFAVVENVIVSAPARRTGVGRTMMRHAQEMARAAGCYKLMLCTGRAENVGFYEACGFRNDKFGLQMRFAA
ncbi:GNAT family N-acetyltransferase [Uliginosibacterium sp. H1]|uniref:GNAT family N-acetyltransferase n=1 Tax=Uliginosibacterium sp. H1 TaxID=3114757 RepID=UPI002E1713A7|nr:GNAT family N-acetyltransferase [Uliginosibacterium sp. H1]